MYARLTIFQIKLEKIEEAIKLYKKSVIPAARLQKGYRGIYLLTDKKTGKGISMGLWNSEKNALANEENLFYQEQLVKFLDFYTMPPIREGYGVSLQDQKKAQDKKPKRRAKTKIK